MRVSRVLSGVVFTVVAAVAGGAEQDDPGAAPILWKGVEVVTNDFDSIERIRGATPLPANSLLTVSDPKLRVACDAVRNRFPSSRIECSHAIEPAKSGRPEAWFVVEVDMPATASLRCLPGARLDPRLVALSQQWLSAAAKPESSGEATGFVNDRNYFDYEEVRLRAIAATLHTATRDRTVEVEAGAVSCNPLERMHSLYLMGFTGDPQRFVTMAAVHVNDEHAGAANAAARFLTTFAEFIDVQDVPHVANEVCKGVLEGNFAARKRSIGMLSQLQETGALPFAQLPSRCQQQLRNIARTSVALPAKELVSEPVRKQPS